MTGSVTIAIGGQATHEAAIAVLDAAADQGLLVHQTDEYADEVRNEDAGAIVFDDLVRIGDGTLGFYAPVHESDRFVEVEAECRRQGLPYVSTVDGDEEADGFTRWWIPGMDDVRQVDSNQSGEAVIRLSELEAAHADGTVARLIEDRTIPTIPPLEMKPGR